MLPMLIPYPQQPPAKEDVALAAKIHTIFHTQQVDKP